MDYIIGIIALIFCFVLNKKLSKLKNEVAVLKKSKINTKTVAEKIETVKGKDDLSDIFEDNTEENAEETAVFEKPTSNPFIKWIVTDWIMKLGALLIIMGVSWFVSYAFMNNWIGPVGRIAFGLVCGALILLLGEIRIRKFLNQGAVFLGLGAGVILLTIFSAREVYDFFTPITALVMMAFVVVLISVSAVKHKLLSLAMWGLVLGNIAPLLINSPDPSMVGLFSYLFILALGIIWIVSITSWRILVMVSLVFIAFYQMSYLFEAIPIENNMIALGFAIAFLALFYLANLAIITYNKKSTIPDLITIVINATLFLGWINLAIEDRFQSFITVLVALVFVAGAFILFKFSKLKEPVYVYSAIACVLLAVATALELDGQALVIAYTLEILALSFLTSFITKSIKDGQQIGLLFVVPILMSFESIDSSAWNKGVLHDDFFVLFVLGLSLLSLAIYSSVNRYKNVEKSIKTILYVASGFYFTILLWLSLEALIKNIDTAHMIALIIYTSVGLFFYIFGKSKKAKNFVIVGGILIGLVVLRLVIIDVWDMDLAGRIATFLIIGTMFIGTAFIKKKS